MAQNTVEVSLLFSHGRTNEYVCAILVLIMPGGSGATEKFGFVQPLYFLHITGRTHRDVSTCTRQPRARAGGKGEGGYRGHVTLAIDYNPVGVQEYEVRGYARGMNVGSEV